MPKAEDVRSMFDRIAGRYDLLNRVMTMGVDQRWRTAAVRAAGIGPGTHALDVCCGTGDITFKAAEAGAERVVGLDFSEQMLHHARLRIGSFDAASTQSIEFVQGDALDLPFAADTFDAATVGFGVRNVENLSRAFSELARVVRPGGRVACLEITRPRSEPARSFYHLWFDRVVPVIGGAISGDREAYSYLPESTRSFPEPDALARIMSDAGLGDVSYTTCAGGIVAIHTGVVPVKVVEEPAATDAEALPARAGGRRRWQLPWRKPRPVPAQVPSA